MHREPWKYRNTLNCSKMKGKDQSPNSANQSSFTGSSVYHLAGFHPHWHLNANHYSLLCLVIKGKSTHKHCQRRAANMWGSIIWKYPMAGQGAYDSGILPPLCCVTFSKAPWSEQELVHQFLFKQPWGMGICLELGEGLSFQDPSLTWLVRTGGKHIRYSMSLCLVVECKWQAANLRENLKGFAKHSQCVPSS